MKHLSEPWEFNLIQLGEKIRRKKAAVVLRLSQNIQIYYASFEIVLDCYCSLKLNDHIYTMGRRFKRAGDDFNTTNGVVNST